jgi:hypothetical protein
MRGGRGVCERGMRGDTATHLLLMLLMLMLRVPMLVVVGVGVVPRRHGSGSLREGH